MPKSKKQADDNEMRFSPIDEVVEEYKIAHNHNIQNEDDNPRKPATVETAELLETKCFGEAGIMDDPNNQLCLGKIEIWTNKPRFYLKRLPASCFFNPWNYQKNSQNDIKYTDVYGRKPRWAEVSAQIFQLYERFILGEEDEGKIVHNNLLLSQAERLYINSL